MNHLNPHITSLRELRDRRDTASVQRISLSAELRELPEELRRFARSVEVLDLSGNLLDALPPWIVEFTSLQVLFLSRNRFREIPMVLRGMPALRMLGMRACRIEHFPDDSLPTGLRWLTLTDNKIARLPDSLGALAGLQKVLLAGNKLTALPDSLQGARHLELLRLSSNNFTSLPSWLFELPALAWLALAGNPLLQGACGSNAAQSAPSIPRRVIPWQHLQLGRELGRGASGPTFQATYVPPNQPAQEIAVKVFQSTVSSDGSADDEIAAALRAGEHSALLSPIAPCEGHPEQRAALVFRLLPPQFQPLAAPPSFESCSRDVYSSSYVLSDSQVDSYSRAIAEAVAHLHERGITHGDLYAHNTLVDGRSALVSDFGAACIYQDARSGADRSGAAGSRVVATGEVDIPEGLPLAAVEARAFGILLSELIQCNKPSTAPLSPTRGAHLRKLARNCMQPTVRNRPSFAAIVESLSR